MKNLETIPLKSLVSAIVLLAMLGTASAQIIVRPTAVSETGLGTAGGSLVNIIDGSGLSAAMNTGDAYTGTWSTHSTGGGGDAWISAFYPNGTNSMTFTLGGAYTLQGFNLWQYNETGYTVRSFNGFSISTSTDGVNFNSTGITLTSANLPQAPGVSTYTGIYTTLSGTNLTGVTHVRFENISSYAGDNPEFYIRGASEVRFVAVPEPSTWALLTLGGAVLVVLRRRSLRRSAG
ncbi:MAG: PEP-CTERM sorting domain-containing protein [Candidatus Methylacidiphilales bacterium]|nr:PEP-CTERM sorting domain-containing protein [Candidatus Methylacidiphilales bacterium]